MSVHLGCILESTCKGHHTAFVFLSDVRHLVGQSLGPSTLPQSGIISFFFAAQQYSTGYMGTSSSLSIHLPIDTEAQKEEGFCPRSLRWQKAGSGSPESLSTWEPPPRPYAFGPKAWIEECGTTSGWRSPKRPLRGPQDELLLGTSESSTFPGSGFPAASNRGRVWFSIWDKA